MGHFSSGGRHLRDSSTRRPGLVKVKSSPIRPHQSLWITVVSDRDISRYFGKWEWARLKIDKQRDYEESQGAASDRPAPPPRRLGLGNDCRIRRTDSPCR